MEPHPVQSTPSMEEDEWDTEGFVIPSVGVEDSGESRSEPITDSKQISITSITDSKEENIYLGPHGAPPTPRSKQQELNSTKRKQSFKQKLKEADRKHGGSGRENKVENLRELVGGGKMTAASKNSSKDWLDPHCHESEFEKRDHH